MALHINSARGRNRYRYRDRFLPRHSAVIASTPAKLSLALDPDTDSDRDPDQSSVNGDFVCKAGWDFFQEPSQPSPPPPSGGDGAPPSNFGVAVLETPAIMTR